MFRPFYIAATGMDACQKDLEGIIDNVSNAQTTAFKRSRIEFANLFPEILEKAVKKLDDNMPATGNIELGSGVKIVGTPKDFSQGNIEVTDNAMDIAILGDGFLQFLLPNGEIAYSRAGNLRKDNSGLLIGPLGHILEPQINIPDNTTSIIFNPDGRVFVQMNEGTDTIEVGQITIARFVNPEELESIGDNLYKKNVASGDPTIGIPSQEGFGNLEQYALESSNVDIVKEMMRMVITQRSFDVISKAMQGGEGMLKSALEIANA